MIFHIFLKMINTWFFDVWIQPILNDWLFQVLNIPWLLVPECPFLLRKNKHNLHFKFYIILPTINCNRKHKLRAISVSIKTQCPQLYFRLPNLLSSNFTSYNFSKTPQFRFKNCKEQTPFNKMMTALLLYVYWKSPDQKLLFDEALSIQRILFQKENVL